MQSSTTPTYDSRLSPLPLPYPCPLCRSAVVPSIATYSALCLQTRSEHPHPARMHAAPTRPRTHARHLLNLPTYCVPVCPLPSSAVSCGLGGVALVAPSNNFVYTFQAGVGPGGVKYFIDPGVPRSRQDILPTVHPAYILPTVHMWLVCCMHVPAWCVPPLGSPICVMHCPSTVTASCAACG